jgi:hypothetical protein
MNEETKILRENIITFRHLITEGVSDADISKYINNHEVVFIYYEGDEKTESGKRSVRPYVLGTDKRSGKKVLRAWQDNGASWHFANRNTRPQAKPTPEKSQFHDYWNDKGGTKPGWRMFRVDKISKIYPTGVKFNDSRGGPLIPPGYHEGGDDDMSSIDAYVSTKAEPDFDYQFKKDYEGDVDTVDQQTQAKWDSIKMGNKNGQKISAEEVIKLRDLASRVIKKKHSNFLVVVDGQKNYHLITPKQKEVHQIPDVAILGSLPHLYDSVVNANKTPDSTFFKSKLSQTQQGLNEELPTIPHDKTTFFK